jgi:hypothetical protein
VASLATARLALAHSLRRLSSLDPFACFCFLLGCGFDASVTELEAGDGDDGRDCVGPSDNEGGDSCKTLSSTEGLGAGPSEWTSGTGETGKVDENSVVTGSKGYPSV